jgi:hypothetical protein
MKLKENLFELNVLNEIKCYILKKKRKKSGLVRRLIFLVVGHPYKILHRNDVV